MSPILIDTNVLLYTFDQNAQEKQERSIQVLRQLEAMETGRLSVQSLAEFFSTATRKLRPPLTPADAFVQVERFSLAFPILELTSHIVLEAARGVRDHKLSYYDAQIWATARLNQVPVIFSEDFTSGITLEGVRIINPFASDFVVEAWV